MAPALHRNRSADRVPGTERHACPAMSHRMECDRALTFRVYRRGPFPAVPSPADLIALVLRGRRNRRAPTRVPLVTCATGRSRHRPLRLSCEPATSAC
ncbi:hypothetical protein GCM10010254_18820 [Streptomyces chromofuscus]|nr:hypothetical protein GCM10010254_18820 [Streptomyces chromofuscus]